MKAARPVLKERCIVATRTSTLTQHASSLPSDKKDAEFVKKPSLALALIEKSLERGYRPGIVLIDSGYGNNTSFLVELENKKLNYIGGVAKNRKVTIEKESKLRATTILDKSGQPHTKQISHPTNESPIKGCPDLSGIFLGEEIRLDALAASLPSQAFSSIKLDLEKQRNVWVSTLEVEISRLEGKRTIAIVMNAPTFTEADNIDYLITNVEYSKVTAQWIVRTYSQRNWVEVFYREAKGWLGLKEYQVRDRISLLRHFTLVFCAYTFILWQTLTGGLRRRWADKPLNTFAEAIEAFRTAISFRFVEWLNHNRDVFAAYKLSLGFIWA